jgi:transcriptional antiterminator RfaH
MPILPREPDIFPENLLEIAGPDLSLPEATGDRQWWLMYTLVRQEKSLMRRLTVLQTPFYCPLIKRRTVAANRRVRESFVPLFAGYVFVYGTDAERHQALTTNCISRCLAITDSESLVRDLRQIQRLVSSDAPLSAEARLEAGRRVRVRSGPMAGVEGTVVRRRGKECLLVAIEFLQCGASVLLEDFQVEAV